MADKNEQGTVIVLAIMVIGVISLVLASGVRLVYMSGSVCRNEMRSERLYQAARSGIDYGRALHFNGKSGQEKKTIRMGDIRVDITVSGNTITSAAALAIGGIKRSRILRAEILPEGCRIKMIREKDRE